MPAAWWQGRPHTRLPSWPFAAAAQKPSGTAACPLLPLQVLLLSERRGLQCYELEAAGLEARYATLLGSARVASMLQHARSNQRIREYSSEAEPIQAHELSMLCWESRCLPRHSPKQACTVLVSAASSSLISSDLRGPDPYLHCHQPWYSVLQLSCPKL